MTKNQIEYLKLLEEQRSNRANESLTRERDSALRTYQEAQVAENRRHNVQSERQAVASLDELSNWHSRTTSETERSNKARESEANRSNVAGEAELRRYHDLQTALGYENVNLGYANLDELISKNDRDFTNAIANLHEASRTNKAREEETMRSNKAKEAETQRANKERELETSIHNRISEQQDSVYRSKQADVNQQNADSNTADTLIDLFDQIRRTVVPFIGG